MSDSLLDIEEVLRSAERLGLELSERTFRYYSVIGLLPRPLKGSEDARVHYYPPEILGRLQEIRTLQTEGYSLKQIKKKLEVAPAPPRVPQFSVVARLRQIALGEAAPDETLVRTVAELLKKAREIDAVGLGLRGQEWLVASLERLLEAARAPDLAELDEIERELANLEKLLDGFVGLAAQRLTSSQS